MVDGKMYDQNNIHELEGKIDIRSTCEKRSDSSIIFQGALSPFSNFCRSPFIVDDVEYVSNEQYIQAKKADLFGDTSTKVQIMRADNPFLVKRLGGKVSNYDNDRWRNERKAIAYAGLQQKFKQNETLRELLLNTGHVKDC